MRNSIEFSVQGDLAMFTDPLSKLSGEKFSYPVPTYEALKGICRSIYWKPTFNWVVDKVRIMNPIRTKTKSVIPLRTDGKKDLHIYTYLRDVEYQVQAHIEWNMFRPDLEADRDDGKHYNSAARWLSKGGKLDPFLGTSDCPAYILPCVFGEGESYYQGKEDVPFGLMHHGFTYPNENHENKMFTRLWDVNMTEGIIEFIHPEECPVIKIH